MRIIKARPRVAVYLPSMVMPGRRVTARVVLDASRPVRIAGVICKLIGEETISIGGGNTRRVRRARLLGLEAELMGERELDAGETERRCAFDLPAGLPQSYSGQHVEVAYRLEIAVHIPWWLDRKQSFVVQMRAPSAPVDDPGPTLHTSAEGGPQGRDPFLELSLASGMITPGDTLRGQLALYNTEHNRYEVAKLSLVSLETVFGRRLEARRYSIEIGVRGLGEGEPAPFSMKLPDSLAPCWRSKLWKLDWAFEVDVGLGWRRSLTAAVPVTVLPAGSELRGRERRAPAVIGSKRVGEIWHRVAHDLGLRFDPEEHCMVATQGETRLEVQREHRGSDGLFLVATLRYPHLHLHLDGGEASSLRRLFGGGVTLGDPDWDARHYLTGREEAQVAHFVRPLAEALRRVSLHDLDDESMIVQRQDAGQSRAALHHFVSEVMALASRLPEAREAIPAPSMMEDAEEAWIRLAKRLDTRLERATMAVRGRLDDVPVEIATAWSPEGEALHTAVRVTAPRAIDERLELSWTPEGLERGDLTRLSDRARALFDEVKREAILVDVSREALSQWLPAPFHDAPELAGRAEKLLALGAAMHGERGPYR